MTAANFVFPREYMRAAILVSLLSVWVLVLLFHYLNRYTKREYFGIWTAAWLFYALWLTLGIQLEQTDPRTVVGALRLCCIGLSATFMLWGSLSFLGQRAPQLIFGLFMFFLVVWGLTARFVVSDPLLFQLPVFALNGCASLFAAVSFYRSRARHRLVGIGMLCLGFLLWGLYLFSYPFTPNYPNLASSAFFFSAVLQLFIAVSMIVLVLEDVRLKSEQILLEIKSVNSEKEALQSQILSTEKEKRSLLDEAKLNVGLKQAYEDLRQTQENIMQLERLRALGQMASGIAHDINNALSPVVMLPDMILGAEKSLSAQTRQRLEGIRTAGVDISHIVARLREFYRRGQERESLLPVNLNRLASQSIELTQPRWRDMPQQRGSVVQIETQYQSELPPVLGNESELREALTNLIFNAVDAMPNGGKIVIATKEVAGRPRSGGPPAPGHAILEVRDSGVGMDEHTVRHCLDPFFTTKAARGGTGLGLAMVYGTMERHDGTIQIESQPGQGTTIRLVFRSSDPGAPPAPEKAPDTETVKPMRILCVDDEPLLRSLLKDLLESQHHYVEVADGGEKGIEIFSEAKARGNPFDVVITDLGMPRMDGRQVARIVKANSPGTPVVLLTGWGMLLSGSEASPNVDEVLSKPPRLAELTEALGRIARATPATVKK